MGGSSKGKLKGDKIKGGNGNVQAAENLLEGKVKGKFVADGLEPAEGFDLGPEGPAPLQASRRARAAGPTLSSEEALGVDLGGGGAFKGLIRYSPYPQGLAQDTVVHEAVAFRGLVVAASLLAPSQLYTSVLQPNSSAARLRPKHCGGGAFRYRGRAAAAGGAFL